MNRFSRFDQDEPQRTGPSKRQMEDDLRRAVLNTGGVLVKAGRDETSSVPAKPAGVLRAIKQQPTPPPAAKQTATPACVRYVEAVAVKGKLQPIKSAPPKLRLADPTVLRIEPEYQRDLSRKSHALIQHIIANWDWAKFKPPVCAQTAGGLFVIDGQHTAIAAASHPQIREIPILIVETSEIERRAEAFVSHNRDRVAMTQAQIFHGEVAAGLSAPAAILAAVERAGGSIPRGQISYSDAKPGQVLAIGQLRIIHATDGVDALERIVRIAAMSKIAPAGRLVLRAIRTVLAETAFAKLSDARIADTISSIDHFVLAATIRAAASGKDRSWGGAQLLAERLRTPQ